MHDLWGNVSGSLQPIVRPPGAATKWQDASARLWYDADGIPFLREDEADQASIQQTQAIAIKSLLDAGFEAETVIAAITSGDMTRLSHTGLFSVQLQPAGSTMPAPPQAGRALASS